MLNILNIYRILATLNRVIFLFGWTLSPDLLVNQIRVYGFCFMDSPRKWTTTASPRASRSSNAEVFTTFPYFHSSRSFDYTIIFFLRFSFTWFIPIDTRDTSAADKSVGPWLVRAPRTISCFFSLSLSLIFFFERSKSGGKKSTFSTPHASSFLPEFVTLVVYLAWRGSPAGTVLPGPWFRTASKAASVFGCRRKQQLENLSIARRSKSLFFFRWRIFIEEFSCRKCTACERACDDEVSWGRGEETEVCCSRGASKLGCSLRESCRGCLVYFFRLHWALSMCEVGFVRRAGLNPKGEGSFGAGRWRRVEDPLSRILLTTSTYSSK